MDLKSFDDKCVRIITDLGEVFEGVVSYCDEEYVFGKGSKSDVEMPKVRTHLQK